MNRELIPLFVRYCNEFIRQLLVCLDDAVFTSLAILPAGFRIEVGVRED